MKNIPDLNISIRYKILGAFVVSSATPWICLYWGLTLLQSSLIGLAVALILGWYSSFRILTTITGLKALALKLIPAGLKRKVRPYNDELSNLYHDFEHFTKRLDGEKKTIEAPSDQPATLDLLQRHEFQAELSTGDSVFGIATLMPSKQVEELWAQSQQTGETGKKLFKDILVLVKAELTQFINSPELNNQTRGIIEFQIMFLDDASFVHGVEHYLNEGLSLVESFNTVFSMMTAQLEQAPNPYLKMRVHDLLDLKQRIMQSLSRNANPLIEDTFEAFKDKIVLCENIYPSEIISLKKAGIKGIISVSGTAASHAEILLESFGLSSLSSLMDLPIHLLEGKPLLIDTASQKLILNYIESDLKILAPESTQDTPIITDEITLSTGEPIWVGATINNPYLEATKARQSGADGIGLFRTEMSFMGHKALPTEEELYQEYRHLMNGFADQPVVFRLLDLGSDKLASFQESAAKEENPCMGNRSMRLLIQRPDILRTQLRAILRASLGETTIILPMISGWTELLEIQSLSINIIDELKAEGIDIKIKWGLMVEVPALVECFESVVEHFDSFNIGSNDLTQYTLAVDRNNKEVSAYFRYTHPAILSMIRKIVTVAKSRNKSVILCGEMASRLDLLPLSIGLGLRKFSVPYKKVGLIKTGIKSFDINSCELLARNVMQKMTPNEVEEVIKAWHSAR